MDDGNLRPRWARSAGVLLVMTLTLAACGLIGGPFPDPGPDPSPLPSPSPSASPSPSETSTAGAPNVVVIMTDDQDLASLSVMPKVDALLADEGVTFSNSFVSYSLCCPSRSTLLTGQYAHNHGVLGNEPPFGSYTALDHDNTLPVWLQEAGYHTTHVGKYLNGYAQQRPAPIPPGWSEWYATYQQGYFDYTLNENGTLTRYGSEPEDYQTDVLAERAVDVIQRRAPEAEPFYLSFAPFGPHNTGANEDDTPIPTPAPRHVGAFADTPLPMPASFNEADVSDKPARISNRPPLTPADVETITARHRARLETLLSIDEAVEDIVAALDDAGELDNTLILFTSDNGWMQGEHRVPDGKVLVYEPSVRVPLVVRGPGVAHGANVDRQVSNIDLVPTIVDLAGATAGRTMDGISLLPNLAEPDLSLDRDGLLIESYNREGELSFSTVRTPQHLYAEYDNGDRELYDMEVDPDQLESRHDDPALSAVQAELAQQLSALRTCSGAQECG